VSDLAAAIAAEVGGSASGSAGPGATGAAPDPLAAAIAAEVGGGVATAAAAPAASAPAAPGPAGSRPGAGRVRVAVIGDEGVAAATAGHLALLGFDTAWTTPRSAALEPFAQGVELVGMGRGRPRLVASLDEAIRGRDLIIICSHATEHAAYAALLASVLADGQVVVLSPGRTGGALEFAAVLRAHCCPARVVVGETETAVYTPAGRGPGRIEILVEKQEIRAAAFPATDNGALLHLLRQLYPQVAEAENVLDTSINNVGGIVHPAAMLLNSYATERAAAGEPLIYYQDQVNPTVANLVMEPLDDERVAVGKALGLGQVLSFGEWSAACFGHAASTIRDTVSSNPSYAGFGAPRTLLALGFVDDEVPNSLVPLVELGRLVGVPTPMTDALIDLAAAMLRIDFRRGGRTLARLGLEGLEPGALIHHVNTARTRVPIGV
jgi:opine dehydrogenase